ncbi:ligase-associated DNA damage response endonuclease PdeM [Sphingobacterium sp. DK4209]|uniref:Ligase-associated DNA damage response endonuclease PdeM n=1 Tax=Sphingobacterium zhuxiongii TaxID=2662364 RepID=A0A5Q0QFP5_9SPHI|nr:MULTISPECIES: ligase-associated DNA damage response endonuclease PdeM [unclassified Sphingobacterium]MVZ66934.1 ligase-associated DNA damage response endonuclease PdeM [Sphingobacterium sp. DK4209]QGA26648.1 ligase-associated DNA damage response endonuclease PdeM [Sphingobacterium sp. dk4302]
MAKKVVLCGLDCFLLPQKALYIPKHQLLVISDWHLGKLMHFRKEGIFVPAPAVSEELSRLDLLLAELAVEQVLFLGDLFHSKLNSEWEEFCQYTHSKPHIQFTLTNGNHDILSDAHWGRSALRIVDHVLLEEGLLFSHEPLAGLDNHIINVVGHIHPGCQVFLSGRQTFRLPCFHFENRVLTLPAFGKYTGLHILRKTPQNRVYAIVDQSVMELP